LAIFWPPWKYFGPPLDDFCPLRLLSWAIIFRERWFLGQKDTPIPVETFFFLENACFWDKKQSNFGEEPYFALQKEFGAFGLAPPVLK